MRTQPHKSHLIDDLLEEIDDLSTKFGWLRHRTLPIYRSDLHTVRKDVLIRLHEVLHEARRRLDT